MELNSSVSIKDFNEIFFLMDAVHEEIKGKLYAFKLCLSPVSNFYHEDFMKWNLSFLLLPKEVQRERCFNEFGLHDSPK